MRDSIALKILYSTSIILMMIHVSFAQTDQVGNIDFKVENEELSSALYRLSTASGLNFTYDASDILFSTIVSYSTTNTPPLTILTDLLLNTTLTFKQIGNQIVIYKDKKEKDPIEEEIISKPAKIDNVVVIPIQDDILLKSAQDTVFVIDTIFTILSDTIRITDTVFVERELAVDTLNSQDNNTNIIFDSDAVREDGWSLTASFAPILSGFSLANQNKTFDVRNFSLGVEVSKISGKWNFIGGLKLTHFAEKFNHSYNIVDGGYFVTDTVDQYYTVVEYDTTWYFVTDSSWKPTDYSEYNYNINNRLGYLELAALVSYEFYSYGELKFYGKAGFQMSVLVYRTGLAIPDIEDPKGVDFANLSFKSPTFSFLLGGGLKYRINDRLDFNPELYYFRSLNQAIANYPLDKKIGGLGLKIGLTYYF